MSLSQDLTDAINKNLSAEVGQVLRKELERIPALEAAKRLLEQDRDNANNVIEVLRAKVKTDESLKAREEALVKAEKALAERELKVLITEATSTAVAHHVATRVDDMKELVSLVFKNQIVRQEMFGSVSRQVPTTNGYTQTATDSTNSTTRAIPE